MLQFNRDDGRWYTTGDKPEPVENPQPYKAAAPGSKAETIQLIEQDLAGDEGWKDKTPAARRQEAIRQYAVMEGRMTTPEQQDELAKQIASYRIPPMSSFAMASPRGQAVMALVQKYNPDYQAQRYAQIGDVMKKFTGGPEGRTLRSMNVAIQHLDVLDEAGKALKNGDMPGFNRVANAFAKQFGYEAPTTYEGLRRVVGTELEKAIAGGVGALADREDLMKAFNTANSPEQMQGVIDGFKNLMAGQLKGLKTQYEAGTGFKDDSAFAFSNMVDPEVRPLLNRAGKGGAAEAQTSRRGTEAGGGRTAAQDQTYGLPKLDALSPDARRKAVDALRANPTLAPVFDRNFGDGAAARVLGTGQGQPAQQQQSQQQPAQQGQGTQAAPQYREGMIATNPKTGEKIIFRNGQWVPFGFKPSAPTSE
jgi:hypothetical protein